MKNLFFHQFLKDLRQTRVLWALWLLFTVIQFGMAAWKVSPSNQIDQHFYIQLFGMVPIIQKLILIVLIPALILQEPTVGVNAFWLTRPIPRGTVLGSKLIALLILVLFPTLGQCTVLLAHGVILQDVFLGGLQIALHELSWIAVIMMLAALSPNFTRYLIAAVVLYALQFAADWIYSIAFTFKHLHKSGDFFTVSPALDSSRRVAADCLRILLSLGVAVFQYQTRRTKQAIVLAVASVLVPFFVIRYWPVNFLSSPAITPPPRGEVASKIELSMDRLSCQVVQDVYGGTPKKAFTTTFKCQRDLSKALSITPMEAEITFPDGKKLHSLPLGADSMKCFNPDGGIIGQSLDAALGYLPTLKCLNTSFEMTGQVFIMTKEDFERYNGRIGKLSVRVKVQCSDYRVTSEWPLQKGAVVSKGSDRSTIAEILQQKEGVRVDLQIRTVQLQLRPPQQQGEVKGDRVYALVNTKKGVALVAGPAQQEGNTFSLLENNPVLATLFGENAGGKEIELVGTQSVNFGPRRTPFHQTPLPITMSDEWLFGAKLLEMEKVPVSESEITMTTDDFKITSANDFSFFLKLGGSSSSELPDSLKGLELPENPSRSDVWKYILRIVGAKEENNFSEENPEIALLVKVGPANADELLLALYNNGCEDNDLIGAINKLDLSGTPCKEMVLRYLPGMQSLIGAVIKNHWEADAKGTLLEGITNASRTGEGIDRDWIRTLASVRDPTTYPALLTYEKGQIASLLGSHNDYWENNPMYLIRELPGPVISSMIAEMWKDSHSKESEGYLIGTAASWGIPSALDRAGEILRTVTGSGKDQQRLRSRARKAILNTTACPAKLLDVELAAWYDANKASLFFDPHLGRFLVHARPSLDQQAPWPEPGNYMKKLGELAAKGNTAAIDDIADALMRLVEGLDPAKDAQRIDELQSIGYDAYNVLGEAVVKDPASFKVLEYANGKDHLNKNFVTDAYSVAAAHGNQTALDALIHYKDHNWPLFNAIRGLSSEVKRNNPQAVDFVLNVYADPATAMLTNAENVHTTLIFLIRDAANAGNEKALAVYKELKNNGKLESMSFNPTH
jgi:ABC-type transport system involved in multi-copper enzyme maturation permease subunit